MEQIFFGTYNERIESKMRRNFRVTQVQQLVLHINYDDRKKKHSKILHNFIHHMHGEATYISGSWLISYFFFVC
jgi:hypothetical protein